MGRCPITGNLMALGCTLRFYGCESLISIKLAVLIMPRCRHLSVTSRGFWPPAEELLSGYN